MNPVRYPDRFIPVAYALPFKSFRLTAITLPHELARSNTGQVSIPLLVTISPESMISGVVSLLYVANTVIVRIVPNNQTVRYFKNFFIG